MIIKGYGRNFSLNLIILFLSLINIWKCRKLNIKKANYFIIKDTKDLIDPRSIRFANLKKKIYLRALTLSDLFHLD